MTHPAGSVKRHPDWPENTTIAQRTNFEDGVGACSSWLAVNVGRVQWLQDDVVADWPDVEVV